MRHYTRIAFFSVSTIYNYPRGKISKIQNVMFCEFRLSCIPLLSATPVEKVLVAFYFFLTTMLSIGAIEDKKARELQLPWLWRDGSSVRVSLAFPLC